MESKTEGAKQASDTFEKKADATKRAQDIAIIVVLKSSNIIK